MSAAAQQLAKSDTRIKQDPPLRRLTSVLVMLIAVSCGDSGSAATTTPPASSTTTTTSAATTTTALDVFSPRQPTRDEISGYDGAAISAFSDTAWDYENWDSIEFFRLLRNAPLEACNALFSGEVLSEAARSAMQATPLVGQDPSDYPPQAAVLWTVFALEGMPIYCPELASGLTRESVADAWRDLIEG